MEKKGKDKYLDYFHRYAINLQMLPESHFAFFFFLFLFFVLFFFFFQAIQPKILYDQRPDPPRGGILDEDQVDLEPPPPKEELRSSLRHLSLLGWDV
jgi:hypothetical protein